MCHVIHAQHCAILSLRRVPGLAGATATATASETDFVQNWSYFTMEKCQLFHTAKVDKYLVWITAKEEVRDERHIEKGVHSWKGKSHIQQGLTVLVPVRCLHGQTLNPAGLVWNISPQKDRVMLKHYIFIAHTSHHAWKENYSRHEKVTAHSNLEDTTHVFRAIVDMSLVSSIATQMFLLHKNNISERLFIFLFTWQWITLDSTFSWDQAKHQNQILLFLRKYFFFFVWS